LHDAAKVAAAAALARSAQSDGRQRAGRAVFHRCGQCWRRERRDAHRKIREAVGGLGEELEERECGAQRRRE
jgi:cytochrome c2